MISVYVFQSTHPRGVRPTTRLWNFRLNRFNPRTHEGCDPAILLTNSSRRVSIHAPTRGATGKNLIRRPRSEFQSTHPRGVRLYIRRRTIYRSSFNPRTHEGCDSISAEELSTGVVSIHAPTRGATQVSGIPNTYRKVSIHAPTRGATTFVACARECAHVSIHAPTRGATIGVFLTFTYNDVSIHAPTRGATSHIRSLFKRNGFQSTHPRGVRHR